MRRYVGFLPLGMDDGWQKNMVFVPLVLSLVRPLHRRATSLEQPSIHLAASSPLRRCRYS